MIPYVNIMVLEIYKDNISFNLKIILAYIFYYL